MKITKENRRIIYQHTQKINKKKLSKEIKEKL